MPGKFPCVLLASGGLDSFVAYHYLNKPQTVYFDIGCKYTDKELSVVQDLFPGILVDASLRLGDTEQEDAHVPFRNLFFFMLSAARYSDNVYIAGVKDDAMSDKSPTVFLKFSDLLSNLEGRKIQVMSPFWHMTKVDVLRWYLNAGHSKEDLLKTVSCYSDKPTNYCGACASCFRKWASLWTVGIRLDYHNATLMKDYRKRCLAGKYDQARSHNTVKAVDEYQASRR